MLLAIAIAAVIVYVYLRRKFPDEPSVWSNLTGYVNSKTGLRLGTPKELQ